VVFGPIFISHHCAIVMSADLPGPLSIDRSSVRRQAKRAHPLIDRNAIYPMIRLRGIGDGVRSVVGQAGTCRVASPNLLLALVPESSEEADYI
jgi:hypothetical protein